MSDRYTCQECGKQITWDEEHTWEDCRKYHAKRAEDIDRIIRESKFLWTPETFGAKRLETKIRIVNVEECDNGFTQIIVCTNNGFYKMWLYPSNNNAVLVRNKRYKTGRASFSLEEVVPEDVKING